MNRIVPLVAALLFVLALGAPAALAADAEMPNTGRVLMAFEGDITVPSGEQADLVLVTQGTATIEGEVNTVVVIDGTATLTGARTETVVAIRAPVTIGAGSIVQGQVLKLDAEITRVGDAQVVGGVRDIALDMAGLGLFLGPALVLVYLGFTIAAIAAGLLIAALAARQVRAAERVISREPLTALAVGIGGTIASIVLVIALFVTIVGAPLAFGILLGLLPAVAFAGYLVAGIWIGEWLLARTSPAPRERPYLAAVIGIVLLQILSIWPFFTMIASLFGFGAIVLVAWRTFSGRPATTVAVTTPTPAPVPG